MKLRTADIEPMPDVFVAVVTIGILSIAARNHHYFAISGTLGILALLNTVSMVLRR